MSEEEWKFLEAYMTTGSLLQAFRSAFDPESQIPDDEAIRQGMILFGREDVAIALMEWNLSIILQELNEARTKAMGEPGGAHAAVAASVAKAHFLGVLPGGGSYVTGTPELGARPAASGRKPTGKRDPKKGSGGLSRISGAAVRSALRRRCHSGRVFHWVGRRRLERKLESAIVAWQRSRAPL